jgi:hypothetical protein
MVDVETWYGQFDQNFVIYGDTREEVEEKVATLLSNYPNAGFGTNFRQPIQDHNGKWKATGYRYLNCD